MIKHKENSMKDNENIIKKKIVCINSSIEVHWELDAQIFNIINIDNQKKYKCECEDRIENIIKINENLFLIIRKDKRLEIWDTDGNKQNVIQNPLINLISIRILENEEKFYIFILLKNESIKLLNQNLNEIYSLETEIETDDNIAIHNRYFEVLEKNSLNLHDLYNGELIFSLKEQRNFIEDFKLLNNKNLIVKDINHNVKLFDIKGEILHELTKLNFNLDKCIETESNSLIILSKDNYIKIIDKFGKLQSSYKPNNEIIEHFNEYINGKTILNDLENNRYKIEQYYHLSNPYDRSYIAEKILNDNNINLDNEKIRYLWNFFNRPIFSEIRSILKKEEKETIKYNNIFDNLIEDIKENINNINKNIDKLKLTLNRNLILGIILLFVSIGVYLKFNLFIGLTLCIFSIFMFFIYINTKNQIKLKNEEIKLLLSEIDTINIVIPEIKKFLYEIKNFREKLIQQIPLIKDRNLYNGDKAKEIIQDKIDNEIYNEALNYCGLVSGDIVSVDGEPIVFNEGSLLQEFKHRINKHNLNSFWVINDGSVLFASQYIQYIFLTKEKIDIFSCHYDFILDKFVTKEAQAFYYKDVTNISKKDVERNLLTDKEKSLATEITLKVSSGDKISVTVFSKETVKEFNENASEKNKDEIEKLKSKIKEIQDSKEYESNDKKDADIRFYQDEIDSLEQDSGVSEEAITLNNDEINKTIQNIRKHVKDHK